MRTLILLLLAGFYCPLLFPQRGPVKTPADPNFYSSPKDFLEMKANGVVLPPIRPAENRWKNYQHSERNDFPVVYDMRDSAWVTPVKTQSAGACWAYSVMGALESRLLMLGYGTYDLSDNNLKQCHKYVPERSTNGNHWMATAYFARRDGPYLETEDPYPGGTSGPGNCPGNLNALFYVHQARYPIPQNIDAIKQTVLEIGAVWSLMYFKDTYLNPTDHTYYFDGTTNVNHAGCVVGWNDTIVTAGGTGAWIVRNTYGPAWADNGYYYVSYNDSQFLKYNAYWPTVMETEEYTAIFQHDEIGGYWGAGGWNEVAYGLVKFEGPAWDMEITKIGSFVVYGGCGIEIKIYSQFGDSLSGLLGSQEEEVLELPGYYTFNLDSAILIPAGQDFYVQVKYNSNHPELLYPVPIEDTIAGYSMPEIETGKYWINPDPVEYPDGWFQLGHGTDFHYDLCIKAYMKRFTAIHLADIVIPEGSDTCFEALQTLCLAGNNSLFTVETGASAYLIAGSKILMHPGTHFQNGSSVTAFIEQGENLCNSLRPSESESFFEDGLLSTSDPQSNRAKLFSIFPNPGNGLFTLVFDEEWEQQRISLQIVNLMGDILLQKEFQLQQLHHEFNLTGLPKGIYIISARSGNLIEFDKVVIQ
ncbi:MAG: T9SS type A sorting domain-containing protein [Bacteroidales bacterium]|nr:T9SS type A sorting domain-containing protein [Bacteroidales bacterium]